MRLAVLSLQTVVIGEVCSSLPLGRQAAKERGTTAHQEFSYVPKTKISLGWHCRISKIDVLFLLLEPLCIHGIQRFKRKLEVGNQSIAARLSKVFPHDHTHELHLV